MQWADSHCTASRSDTLPLTLSSLQVYQVGSGRRVVEIDGQVLVHPLRTWLLPATLLLPRVIPIHATIRVGVNSQDKVRGGGFRGEQPHSLQLDWDVCTHAREVLPHTCCMHAMSCAQCPQSQQASSTA